MTDRIPINITLAGSTGLTGNAALHSLLLSPSQPFTISTITRSAPKIPIPILKETTHSNRIFGDLNEAVTAKEALGTAGGVYATCLGTTRAQAGSFENQRNIDLVLNRELAKRAKADGCTTGILLSSGASSSSSYAPYLRMKGELEDEFKAMGFERTIILRPGLLLGPRNDTRTAEWLTQKLFKGMGAIGLPMKSLMIEAQQVGDCIAYLASHPPSETFVSYGNNEMIDLANRWREQR